MLGACSRIQRDHVLDLVEDRHQEGNTDVVVALLEFADELALGRVLQDDRRRIQVLRDVFERKLDVHRARAENALGAGHLAVQQFISHRWRIAVFRPHGTTYSWLKELFCS